MLVANLRLVLVMNVVGREDGASLKQNRSNPGLFSTPTCNLSYEVTICSKTRVSHAPWYLHIVTSFYQ